MSNFGNLVFYIFMTMCCVVIYMNGYILLSNRWETKPYEYRHLEIPEYDFTISKEEARLLVSDYYGVPHFYGEDDLEGANGLGIVLFRAVWMDNDLTIEDYIPHYAHELTHLKNWCANETYTTYMTFVTLYESGNEILKQASLCYARDIIGGGYDGTEYDCGYYILEYLKLKEVKSE